MIMGFTDYKVEFDPGIPGSPSSGLRADIRGKYNASGGVLAYGRAVVQGTNPKDVILPASDKTDFVGIVLRTYFYEDAQGSDLAYGYPAKTEIDVVTSGDIWVEVEEAVEPGDPVYFRKESKGANTVVGKFRKTDDRVTVGDAATATAVLITNARWLTKTAGAGIASLNINLT